MASVVTCQPKPNRASRPSSKSEIKGSSGAAGSEPASSASARATAKPSFHTAARSRLRVRSASRSPFTRTRSASAPSRITPRSGTPKAEAGSEVAAASASAGSRPARSSRRSSPCMETPAPVPGLGASVPARIGTPAAWRRRTFSRAVSGEPEAPGKLLLRVWRCIAEARSAVSSSSAPPIESPAAASTTERVGATKTPASANDCASSSGITSSAQVWTRPSAPAATAWRARSSVLTWTTASRSSACAASINAATVAASSVGVSKP